MNYQRFTLPAAPTGYEAEDDYENEAQDIGEIIIDAGDVILDDGVGDDGEEEEEEEEEEDLT